MKIELQPSATKKRCLELIVNDELWGVLNSAIYGRIPKLSASTAEELKNSLAELEYRGAKKITLNKLSRKSCHSKEIIKSLSEKGASAPTIKKIIAECRHLGYLDDDYWVESFLRNCMEKKFSIIATIAKLQKKGFLRDEARDVISKAVAPDCEKNAVERLLTTRYKHRDLTSPKERQKVVAALLRKGFRFDIVIEATRASRFTC